MLFVLCSAIPDTVALNRHNTVDCIIKSPVVCRYQVTEYKTASYKTPPRGHLLQEATLTLLC